MGVLRRRARHGALGGAPGNERYASHSWRNRFNGRLLIRLSDDSVERMNSEVEKTRKMKTRQKRTNPREKMNHLRRLMRMGTLRSGRGTKMTKWNGQLRRFACTQLLI